MWKIISIFTLFSILSLNCIAKDGELEILLTNKKAIELSPGANSNIALMLVNNSDTDKDFQIKITTPKELNQLTDYSSIIVERNSRKLKIFSFYVSDEAKVGDYTIIIEAIDKDENIKIGKVEVPVYVVPYYEIQSKLLQGPDYVFSGDTFSVQFVVQNLSNTKATLNATIINMNFSEQKTYTVQSDSSIFIRVFVTTVKDIMFYIQQSVSLTVSIAESPETKSETSYTFDVIPSTKRNFDSFNRIPTKISGLFVTNNQTGKRLYGYMFDVVGSGTISKKKNRDLAFHFRGPNRQGNPILGQTDEYNLKYSSNSIRAVLGDNSYRLTDLTEGSRSGRGGEYEHKFKNIRLGTFVNFPRFYPTVKRVISAYASYLKLSKYEFKIGFLNKTYSNDTSAQLATISGELSPFKWGDIKFEFASGIMNGEFSMAYSTDLRARISRFRVFFNYSKADDKFPGYLTNSQYISSGLNTSFGKIDLSLNYNLNHTNIALDTMYSNAPFSNFLNFTTGYSINYNHNINLSFNLRNSVDMNPEKQFDYKEYTARLGFRSRIKRFGINAYGAYGKTENFLPLKVGETKNVLNANMTLQYKISNNIFIKTFVSYISGQQYLSDDVQKFFYGTSVDAIWGNRLKLLFQYQNNYQVEDYYKDRSLLGLNSYYKIHNNHEVGASVNYDLRKNTLNQTVLSASLRYTYTINIPISRRDDIGGVTGKIINNGVDNVENILLTLAGNVVFTDENGEFEIPYIETGTYFLFMDNSKTGLNTIAERPGPYKIDILPGEKTYFEVALTKSGKINGSIIIEEDSNKNKKGFIPTKSNINKLIIEVNKDDEVYRVFTDENGDFSFNDLRPGLWKLIVYGKGIPDGLQLVNDRYDVQLNPSDIKTVNVLVKKKSRKIKFQR